MTDKPMTEWTKGDLRRTLDRLHEDRERYDRANRIVEARSCELEIAEATRALAIVNRRATEEEDQRAAEERAVVSALRMLRSALVTWRADVEAACLDWGHTITDRIDGILTLAPQPEDDRALTADEVRVVVLTSIAAIIGGAHLRSDERDAIAARVAEKLAGRVVAPAAIERAVDAALGEVARQQRGIAPNVAAEARTDGIAAGASIAPAQRETGLREAFIAGVLWGDENDGGRPEYAQAAAEYARSKAGG